MDRSCLRGCRAELSSRRRPQPLQRSARRVRPQSIAIARTCATSATRRATRHRSRPRRFGSHDGVPISKGPIVEAAREDIALRHLRHTGPSMAARPTAVPQRSTTTARQDASSQSREVLDLSVVVPVHDEQDNVEPLYDALATALEALGRTLRDHRRRRRQPRRDVSRGSRSSRPTDDALKLVKLRRNYGQTAAMAAGFDHARGRGHRPDGRRPAERPGRHRRAPREDRRGLRRRQRLAARPPGRLRRAGCRRASRTG